MTGYAYLWEFQAKPASEAKFELHYGPDGTWAQLFRRSADYMATLLLKDDSVPGRYLTLDLWRNEAAFQAFKTTYASEYAQLDNECERLTLSEKLLGNYST